MAMRAWIESSGLISLDQPPFGLSPSSGTETMSVIRTVLTRHPPVAPAAWRYLRPYQTTESVTQLLIKRKGEDHPIRHHADDREGVVHCRAFALLLMEPDHG